MGYSRVRATQSYHDHPLVMPAVNTANFAHTPTTKHACVPRSPPEQSRAMQRPAC